MSLKELITNRISSEWKNFFNHNVREMKKDIENLERKNHAVNERISNLVLHSGGNSPNEVIDARVDDKGSTHKTLQDRLLKKEQETHSKIVALTLQMNNLGASVEQINKVIQQLFASAGATLNLYVSMDGDDRSGNGSEENPFKTIQTAVNVIPLINTSAITIWIDDGVYLEDVRLANIQGSQIVIRSIQNLSNSDPAREDMPVKVRSISFFYCSGYFQTSGIQFIDQANAPVFGSHRYSLLLEQGGYLGVHACKFSDSTINISNHRATYCGGLAKMHITNTRFDNQNCANFAILFGETRLSNTVTGSGNSVGVHSNNATIRDGTTIALEAANKRLTSSQGLIIGGGEIIG
ncbi:hypothetical protein ACRFD3_000555 [Enterococcus faecium]